MYSFSSQRKTQDSHPDNVLHVKILQWCDVGVVTFVILQDHLLDNTIQQQPVLHRVPTPLIWGQRSREFPVSHLSCIFASTSESTDWSWIHILTYVHIHNTSIYQDIEKYLKHSLSSDNILIPLSKANLGCLTALCFPVKFHWEEKKKHFLQQK